MRRRRWLLAAAVVLPLLAACTSTVGRVQPGGACQPPGGQPRMAHRPGEAGVRAELGHPVRGSVPGPGAAAAEPAGRAVTGAECTVDH